MKRLCQYTKDGEFVRSYDSISEAAQEMDCDESTIRKGMYKGYTPRGYIWKLSDIQERGQPMPLEKPSSSPVRILLLDIETAPIIASVWSLWKQNINPVQVESDWFCLTWSAKWLFDTKISSDKLTPEEVDNEDDGRIMKEIWELVNEADIVITHNGDRFDIPRLNTRFLTHQFPPPSPYQSIDTLKAVKRSFAFSSNKLDYINEKLHLNGKMAHQGFELWRSCLKGDTAALRKMEEYNRNDVSILEELYLEIRPWIKGHPNVGIYLDTSESVCPICGSDKITKGEHRYYTSVSVFETFRCDECTAVGRFRSTIVSLEKRKKLTVGLAR